MGQGSYGQVIVRNGKAVKKFSKVSHLVQEYMALRYLSSCQYVVHEVGVDFGARELHMELFDCNMRMWIEDQRQNKMLTETNILILLRDILLGLIELHDRDLAHGDLKPGNILVRTNKLGAVLGDCGFVSVAKYAKVDRTAPAYREKNIDHSWTHDMYSFGIFFIELMGNYRVNKQTNYEEIRKIVRHKVKNDRYRKLAYNLVHDDKSRRPTARQTYELLYRESAPDSGAHISARDTIDRSRLLSISNEKKEMIRRYMKKTSHLCNINRPKKGYGAIIYYLDHHDIDSSQYNLYVNVALMIQSSMFGQSGFSDAEVIKMCKGQVRKLQVYEVLTELLNDDVYISILLAPHE